ncbi:hypothetical protein [Streptomyces sp. NBC_00385]|uniref:hypothetical protein n=1 Tax=Streptomyces sp. NBC_00385 TaxID=2975733 RepID=UPI002DDA211B|nr:hypothetical protein [Streptomyces sp. NBC_00385]WRZ03015.1 hypothetical protein OG959_06470 [Streptomyces sp. NBC_00385]
MFQARPTTTSDEAANTPRREGRPPRTWRALHEPAAGVPRWARRAAYAVPLVVLPSGIWRLGVLLTADKRGGSIADRTMNGYVVFLTLISEIPAFTAVGLVARWGEVFPRWMPGFGGRRVPPAAAVVPAAIGATILTLVFTVIAIITTATQSKINGDPLPADFPSKAGGWETVYFYASYAPLVLWGPMLGILTYAYWRRRRSATAGPPMPSAAGSAY